MCARFTLTLPDYAALARALGVEIAGAALDLYHPTYNAAPGGTYLLLRENERRRELVPARWGFIPRWAKEASIGAKLINARAETAHEKPTFRDAFAKRRCVVPADGFYEWKGQKGEKKPFWFHPPAPELLYMAGLYELWKNPETGQQERTFTVLTTPPNEVVREVHTRMPALLERDDVDVWLGAPGAASESVTSLLRPAHQGALVARRVSTRVNAVTHDDPSLIVEDCSEEQSKQPKLGKTLSLFKI